MVMADATTYMPTNHTPYYMLVKQIIQDEYI